MSAGSYPGDLVDLLRGFPEFQVFLSPFHMTVNPWLSVCAAYWNHLGSFPSPYPPGQGETADRHERALYVMEML